MHPTFPFDDRRIAWATARFIALRAGRIATVGGYLGVVREGHVAVEAEALRMPIPCAAGVKLERLPPLDVGGAADRARAAGVRVWPRVLCEEDDDE